MDILQITYFCEAAESENFSRVAQKYRVPTSNISQIIRRLENDLGQPLFDRRANRVFLNAQGRLFYRQARAALDALDEARRLLTDDSEEVSGELRIFVGCNRATVAKAIERFRAEYPGVFFSLDHHRMDDPTNYDIIISDEMDRENYEKRRLVREKILVAVSADHPLAGRGCVKIEMLSETRFIAMHEDSCLSRLFHRVCRNAGFDPRVVIRCDDPAYMRRYVEMGLGAAFIPSYSWAGLFSEGVICLEPEVPIFRDTNMFFRPGNLSRGGRLFVDCLAETFGGDGK